MESLDAGFCVVEVLFDDQGEPADYRYLEVNASFRRLTGLADPVGWTVRDLEPRHEAHWFQVYGRVARTGSPERFVNHARHLGDRWYEEYAIPIDGHVGVLFTDVTERRRAEAAVRASEARFRDLADAAPATLWVTEPDGSCSFLSRGWYEFTGQTEETGLGFGWLDAVHPDDRAGACDAFLAANGRREPFALEHRVRRADGVYRWVIDAARPRSGVGGNFLGYIGSVIDIDDRKRAERRLRDQELLLRESAELAQVGGWSFDPVTTEGVWTAEAARIHGVEPAAVATATDEFSRYVGESRTRIEAAVQAARDYGTPYDLELDLLTADGVRKRVRAICRPVVEDGKVVLVRGSLQDITERHRLEEQFRQAQKMEAFGQLAGGVAHDFNNMLQVIAGYADLLSAAVPPGDPRSPLVAEIAAAADRSAALTRQLLAFSRHQAMAPRIVDVCHIAGGTAGMLRRVIGEDVRLETDLPPGIWPVCVDPGQLEQVLLNLAVNARDAMPRGGVLSVTARNEWVSADAGAGRDGAAAGPHAVLAVADTGSGMEEEVLARVFEPFFTTKEVGKGTGLGLATVYGIVRQAGGHLRVASTVGQVSTFEVFLPRAGEHPTAQEPFVEPRDASTRVGTETVLVVEDEPVVAAFVRTVLAGLGYTVLEACDGESAGRVAAGHPGPVHLVLSDVVMPGADGRPAAARVLASHPGAKVVYMSGYAGDAIARQGVSTAEVPFLPKPFTPAALAALVRRILDAPA